MLILIQTTLLGLTYIFQTYLYFLCLRTLVLDQPLTYALLDFKFLRCIKPVSHDGGVHIACPISVVRLRLRRVDSLRVGRLKGTSFDRIVVLVLEICIQRVGIYLLSAQIVASLVS